MGQKIMLTDARRGWGIGERASVQNGHWKMTFQVKSPGPLKGREMRRASGFNSECTSAC
jgi:hypothetical protein